MLWQIVGHLLIISGQDVSIICKHNSYCKQNLIVLGQDVSIICEHNSLSSDGLNYEVFLYCSHSYFTHCECSKSA